MRELSSLGTMASTGSLRVTEARDTASFSNRSLRSVVSASARVVHLLKQAMTCFETDRKAAWRCLSEASTLIGAVVEDPGACAAGLYNIRAGGLANWQASRTLAYIEANLGSKLETSELASVVALSRSHFSRAFKQSVGLSPMEYVGVRRVERAKMMIGSTQERLAEVAIACGFADQAHLSRRFRDLMGMSPGQWRRTTVAASKSLPRRGIEAQATAEARVRPSHGIDCG
jgi:AraC family transcriptional regulator